MRTRLAILAAAFLLGAPPLLSQDQSSGEKNAEVTKLMEVMGVKKMMDAMLPAMMTQMDQQMEQIVQQQIKDRNLPEGYAEKFKELRKFISTRVVEEMKSIDLEGLTVRIYAKHFTTDEVRGMILFYESPVGRKMLEKTPAIMQESMAETMGHTQQMMEKLMKEMKEKFPEIFAPPPPQP